MEVGDITYTEYSYEECEKILDEYNQLTSDFYKTDCNLFETMKKIRGFVVDQGLWNKPIGIEFSKIVDKGTQFFYNKDGRYQVTKIITHVWNSSPKSVREGIFISNINTALILLIKEEIFQISTFQKEADSLLYRCEHLTTKAA